MDVPFILRLNIERYRDLLRTEQDRAKRRVIEQLLADAEGKRGGYMIACTTEK